MKFILQLQMGHNSWSPMTFPYFSVVELTRCRKTVQCPRTQSRGNGGRNPPTAFPSMGFTKQVGFFRNYFHGAKQCKKISLGPNLGDHAVCLGSYVTLLISTGCSWLYHTLLSRSLGAQWGCSQGRTTPESPDRDRTTEERTTKPGFKHVETITWWILGDQAGISVVLTHGKRCRTGSYCCFYNAPKTPQLLFGCSCSDGNVEPQSFEEKPKEAPEVPPVAQTEQLEVVKMDEPKEAPTPLPFFLGFSVMPLGLWMYAMKLGICVGWICGVLSSIYSNIFYAYTHRYKI